LLEQLVRAKAQQLGDRLVGLQDLALQVGDEDGIRGIGDDGVGVQAHARFGGRAALGMTSRTRSLARRATHRLAR
jgi:hypothetical protein